MESSGHKIVPMDDGFLPLLQMAAISGCDVSPMIEGQRYVGFGESVHGYGPICLLDIKETPYVAEPHVTWFPWTSAKERIRAFRWALGYLGKHKQVLLIILKPHIDFYEHFTKKGLLRKIGHIDNLPAEAGEEIHMYQYTREKCRNQ